MEVLRNGKFSITLQSKDLARGLRRSSSNPRDRHGMTSLSGMVAKDGVLQALDELSRIDTDVITDGFPYPQLFVLSNYILICSATKIYDYSSGSLVLKYTAGAVGSTWKCIDFIEYLILTNDSVVVVREAHTGNFVETSTIPDASAICNYNGQIFVGGPETPWDIGDI